MVVRKDGSVRRQPRPSIDPWPGQWLPHIRIAELCICRRQVRDGDEIAFSSGIEFAMSASGSPRASLISDSGTT